MTGTDVRAKPVHGGPASAALGDASWITTPEVTPAPGERPGYEFRTTFDVESVPERASLFATAHGIYEVFVNGSRVGDIELAPGASSYHRTLYVQRYDVAPFLHSGRNELRFVITDGWFRGKCGPRRIADNFGDEIAVIARLEALGGGGSFEVVTGPDWEVARGPILTADLMDGLSADLTRIGAEQWAPVVGAATALTADHERLAWSPSPPVCRMEEYAPVSIRRLPTGRQIVDFGQNINGWVRLSKLGPVGSRTTLTHGEALDARGDLSLENLAYFAGPGLPPIGVGQVDSVVSRGAADDVFEPRHTTHGFRYVAVDGMTEDLSTEDLVAVQVRSDLVATGGFASSDARLNELHRIVVASWRANSCDIPTDCPQRERWGYTGDFQVFARSATFLDDVAGFGEKWLRSLADEQKANGLITNVAPLCGVPPIDPQRPISFDGAAGWGDAATIVPWELYRAYGASEVLADNFAMMKRWVDYCAGLAAGGRHPLRAQNRPDPAPHEEWLWDTGWQWGEWLEPETPFDYAADKAIVATAYLARSARIVADSAELLGHGSDAESYARLADRAADAWRTEFLLPDGALTEPTQANYVRGLAFGLIPKDLAAASAAHLVSLLEANDARLSTGFLSTGLLLPVLADHGYVDLAYRVLFQADEPGWMVMLDRGATTVWEAWNGVDSDGIAHDSLNHYSKGAVIAFLHEYVAGIRPATPGYGSVTIAPTPHPRLESASATLDARCGRISSAWKYEDGWFVIDAATPNGVHTTVTMPNGETHLFPGGSMSFRIRADENLRALDLDH